MILGPRISFFIIGTTIMILLSIVYNTNHADELRSQIVALSLEIQESRSRENLLYKEVKLLDYQIDVLSNITKE